MKIKNLRLEDIKFKVEILFNKDTNTDYNNLFELYKECEETYFMRTLIDLCRKRKLLLRLVELGDFKLVNKNKYVYTIGIGVDKDLDSLFTCTVDFDNSIITNDNKILKEQLYRHIETLDIIKLR